MPGTAHPNGLLIIVLAAVLGVVVLIARFKMPAFIALTLAALFVGLCSGMPLEGVAQTFQAGVGAMLSSIALVVGLGMVIGKLLGESGGAHVVATAMIGALGEKRLPWAMMLVGFLIGIPVFFTVGVVLLAPLLFSVTRESKRQLLALGIPLVAGLSIVHGLTPPHPGPMAAIGILKADPGKTILYSLLLGLPAAAVAGPLFARLFVARRVQTGPGPEAELRSVSPPKQRPSVALTLLTILLPVFLMLLTTVADLSLPPGNTARRWLGFLGAPLTAMLLGTLFAMWTFGYSRGFDRQQVLKLAEGSLGPAAGILLVVGAGGGFNKVLIASGVGDSLAEWAKWTELSPLVLGWMAAALIRVSTGSATVAMTTGAGIVAPLAMAAPGTNLELLVIATGAGSLVLSHVNDGGFWFVKEYFGLTVAETFRSWTVTETILSIVTLLLALVMNGLL